MTHPHSLASRLLLAGLLSFLSACTPRDSDTAAKPAPPAVLRVLVVADEPFAKTLERQWSSRTTQAIEVSVISEDELQERVAKKRLQSDVVIYPTGLLGELAANDLIHPFGETTLDGDSYDFRDVLGLLRQQETIWGRQTYALSFGSPGFVLYYRRDLFESAQLKPPSDWKSYQEVVEKLDTMARSDSEAKWKAVLEPLAPGWASQVLLARGASYARHRGSYSTLFNYATLEPLIAEASFVRALEELRAATRSNAEACFAATPADARRAFHNGEYAMAWSWPSAADTDLPRNVDSAKIGIAPLPGSRDVYNFRDRKWELRPGEQPERVPLLGVAGRLASVAKETRYQREATDMILLLTNLEFGDVLSPASETTTVFRSSQLPGIRTWCEPQLDVDTVGQYREIVEATQASSNWLMSFNLPGRTRYLTALEEAIRSALQGESSAEEALKSTAEKWKALSEQLGLDKQRTAYERSLGMDN